MDLDYMIKLRSYWLEGVIDCTDEQFVKEALLTEEIIKEADNHKHLLDRYLDEYPLLPGDEYKCNFMEYDTALVYFITRIKKLCTAFSMLTYEHFLEMINNEDYDLKYSTDCCTMVYDIVADLFRNLLSTNESLLLMKSLNEVMYGGIYDMESILVHSNRLYRLTQKAYKNVQDAKPEGGDK